MLMLMLLIVTALLHNKVHVLVELILERLRMKTIPLSQNFVPELIVLMRRPE